MTTLFPYDDSLAAYDLGPEHPLKPESFVLAVSLMRAYGLLAEESSLAGDTPHDDIAPAPGLIAPAVAPAVARVVEPARIERSDLELVHESGYVDTVMEASRDPHAFRAQRGVGPGDTPAFHHMHEASAAVCGATWAALRAVVERDATRAFNVAGGLHHAHADRAAGFCVYNDPAVAIAMATRDHPGLRIAYVDIDAHHGDGVQEAFYDRADVLTISVHESGRYLFPGTGRVVERGTGEGTGFALNVPLPPLSDDTCYRLVLEGVLVPALEAFQPDAIVAQCGADAHHADPLTHLGLTLEGYRSLVAGLVDTADTICDGRICCTGGGGYGTYSVVPRAWTSVLATLLGVQLAEELPEAWRSQAEALSGEPSPHGLLEDHYEPISGIGERVRAETAALVDRVRDGSPLLNG